MDPQRTLQNIEQDRTVARHWLLLAAGSLVVAGALALSLVVARMPLLASWVGDPLLFKRALVVHVVLSIVVWFYAFVAGLITLVPSRVERSPLALYGPSIAAGGMGLMLAGALVPGAQPVLSNYVPMIDHPLFAGGLLVFVGGVATAVLEPRLLPGNEARFGAVPLPEASRVGLRTAGVALLCAAVTFFATWMGLNPETPAAGYYEALFWGAGHVLQIASVAAMVSMWLLLLTPVLGRSPLTRGEATVLFALLLLPALAGPLVALQHPLSGDYRLHFTRLMQFGIFPSVLVILGLIVRRLWGGHREGRLEPGFHRQGPFLAFAASAGLCLLGFGLGAAISGSTTMIPAHYHASIGAVTASFMGATYLLLAPLGMPLRAAVRPERVRPLHALARWQPLAFGAGQAVFALGFGFAGAHGMGRKAYGAEQVVRSLPQTVGLVVMGIGGLIAVVGGLSYLWIVIASWRAAARAPKTLFAEGSVVHER